MMDIPDLRIYLGRLGLFASALSMGILASDALAQLDQGDDNPILNTHRERVINHWTKERMAQAIPRDLVLDPRGLAYLRKPDGTLEPYGHQVAAEARSQGGKTPLAKPAGGNSDTTPPSISNMDPAPGTTIGASYTFAATVTDASGIKSVSFVIQKDGAISQSFNANQVAGTDTWAVSLQGFTDGSWSWEVVAKDLAGRGGNSTTSGTVPFMVDTSSAGTGDGSGSGVITNAAWTGGGTVQTAAGRIYFEMPSNAKWKGPWTGYVCSGTVVTDDTGGRSILLTAAHCVYDDVNKAFARNALFIPDQAGTSGAGTDLNCGNDPLGCWAPSFGVVDTDWTTRTFPDNIPWDYSYYVVNDNGAHDGTGTETVLDQAAGHLPISFTAPHYNEDGSADYTHALGYSYSEDPNFMYCAEDMSTNGDANWWLSSCGLSGGSSGGPWVQPMDVTAGSGDVISVNSWGYTSSPGMAGPKLYGSSASCLFGEAKGTNFAEVPSTDGNAGVVPPGC